MPVQIGEAQETMFEPFEDGLNSSLNELARLVEGVVEPTGAPELKDAFDAHRRLGPVWALRAVRPTKPGHALYTPMLCVVAQGAKQLSIGEESYRYDRGRFLLNSVALPASGQVVEASREKPCLWVMIELDPALVASVIVEAGLSQPVSGAPLRAMQASSIDAALLDAVVRLARAFESPDDADFLMPLALREIIYRLLKGNQAARLHQIAANGGQSQRVMGAIDWLRQNFDQPLSLSRLARECGMSLSALHHHFKAVTAMSPLQFQKQMRLQEARRLMVSGDLDAAHAGQKVGYDDPSHFSRDYRRFFGLPPRQHVARVRGEVAQLS